MNVVIVNETLAYPPTSGNRIRTLQLMLRMARRHRITYVCRGGETAAATRAGVEFFRGHGIETVVAAGPAPTACRAVRCCQLAANLLSPLPFAVATHNCPAVAAVVRRIAAERAAVDLWQFEWLPYLKALPARHAGRVLMMAHNVESLIWERYHQFESHPVKRWYVGQQWRKFERFERRIFAAADHVVTVSRPDALLAQSRFGARRVSVVDNGVDADHYAAATGWRDPRRLLFLGSLDWRPNLDAMRLLLDQIFPRVVAQEPAARLCVVGRNPPAWLVRRAAQTPGVDLHADVPDVRPYLAVSGVMVVPLRIGGGSRLKILEAMASGVPVVSSRVGCEGLAVQAGRDLLVADDPRDIAASVVTLIRQTARSAEMAERGRRLARERYDWGVLADRLEHVWEQCVGRGCQSAASALAVSVEPESVPPAATKPH